jgi:hypothetical protein
MEFARPSFKLYSIEYVIINVFIGYTNCRINVDIRLDNVGAVGFEPTTRGLKVRYSDQLSYTPMVLLWQSCYFVLSVPDQLSTNKCANVSVQVLGLTPDAVLISIPSKDAAFNYARPHSSPHSVFRLVAPGVQKQLHPAILAPGYVAILFVHLAGSNTAVAAVP